MKDRLNHPRHLDSFSIHEVCCPEFWEAIQDDSDTEGFRFINNFDGSWRFGVAVSLIKHINFCPWCGKRINEPV